MKIVIIDEDRNDTAPDSILALEYDDPKLAHAYFNVAVQDVAGKYDRFLLLAIKDDAGKYYIFSDNAYTRRLYDLLLNSGALPVIDGAHRVTNKEI